MIYSLFLQSIPFLVAALAVWTALRHFVFSHPLDKLFGPPPESLYMGNLRQMFAADGTTFTRSLFQRYGRVVRVYGMLKERILHVSDPEALRHILVKEQHVYEESTWFLESNKKIFGPSLLGTIGEQHRRQRKMLNPVFSIAHMRKMMPKFYSVAYDLRDILLLKSRDGPREVEMLSWVTKAALEIVSLCGLGKSFSPVTEEEGEDQYITTMKRLTPIGRGLRLTRQYFLPFVVKYQLVPSPLLRWISDRLPMPRLHQMCGIVDIMQDVSLGIFAQKRRELQDNWNSDENEKDFLSILMRENSKASLEDKLPDDEVVAQISTLMFTAMDTTSSALSRILWLLAKHSDVQIKLREEIRKAKQEFDEPDYDQLFSLKYLDAVCRESLRVYTPLPIITRQARQNMILPLSRPIKTTDGKVVQSIYVPKDTIINIPIQAVNEDPGIWGPDSYDWKPERWLSPLPDSVHEARIPGVYSNLLTFAGGSRACIGFKFSEMEMKVLLYVLIDALQFDLGKEEIQWSCSGVSTPSINDNELQPQMPMLISRAAV
ncbi:cytochrome P450 [Ephemerocybe angulata]|uniref:Cytochrome P450 n=1 Tax=Ephemerocybe angulata TaxID=980116 RepID=A0A8H6H953_9AGAR|nr:cytochrome P450 [Tulosesus angulatus]